MCQNVIKFFDDMQRIKDNCDAEISANGSYFNILRVVGVNHYELKHSAIIAELLDPNGSHRKNDLYLKLFLEQLKLGFVFNTKSASVKRENTNSYGRIDIEIISNDKAIIIENKIYANDGDSQLSKYYEYAKNQYGEDNFEIFYLTLHGESASEDSSKDIHYNTISYCNDMEKWILSCAEKSVCHPFIRESLLQYRNLILDLVGKNMNSELEKEIIETLCKKPEYLKIGETVYTLIPKAKKEIFKKEIIPQLKKLESELDLDIKFSELKDSYEEAYSGFRFESKKWQYEVCIEFQFEHSNFRDMFYGIKKISKNDLDENFCRKIEYFANTNSLKKTFKDWIVWNYLDDCKSLDSDFFINIDEKSKKFVECVKEKIKTMENILDNSISSEEKK